MSDLGQVLLIAVIFGAVMAFFVYRDRRTSDTSTLQLPEEERLAQEAAAVRDHWDKERQADKQVHEDEMQPVHEKLQKAYELVEDSGVSEAACDIFGIMWHWPSSSKRDDWKWYMPVENLDGGETPGRGAENDKWLAWTWEGEPYRLELTVLTVYRDDRHQTGDLKLTVGEELVMHLDVSRHGDEYGWLKWSAFAVSALKVGAWMAKLNEFAGRLRIADIQLSRDCDEEISDYKGKGAQY